MKKFSSREYAGPGSVLHLAKVLQLQFKISFAAAIVKARTALGVEA